MSALLDYKEMQRRIFYFYPLYCRRKLKRNKKSGFSWVDGELEVGYSLNEMQGSFTSPVEDLMLYTAVFMLSAGRETQEARDISFRDIRALIDEHGLEALLNQLSDSDAKEVRSDLELLGVV